MFTGLHVGDYKCLLAGEWCMLVIINVGWRVVHVGDYKCWLVSGACW